MTHACDYTDGDEADEMNEESRDRVGCLQPSRRLMILWDEYVGRSKIGNRRTSGSREGEGQQKQHLASAGFRIAN